MFSVAELVFSAAEVVFSVAEAVKTFEILRSTSGLETLDEFRYQDIFSRRLLTFADYADFAKDVRVAASMFQDIAAFRRIALCVVLA